MVLLGMVGAWCDLQVTINSTLWYSVTVLSMLVGERSGDGAVCLVPDRRHLNASIHQHSTTVVGISL